MRLDAHGHPLHTRALSVTLARRADGKLDAHGDVLDLRKRGFVPVGGDLQPSGIVHHMILDGVVDPATAVLETIAVRQPHVAFEPSATSEGESCRDPAGRVAALAGARLDASWSGRLSAEIGGPRGCSHVLTLGQLLGASVAWALGHGAGGDRRWRAGERTFRRDVIVDGYEPAEGEVALALQLTDLFWAPSPPRARAMDRFAAVHEMHALVPVDMGRYVFGAIRAAERRRVAATLGDAPWVDRSAELAGLAGLGLGRGVSAAILERFAAAPEDGPLRDGLLMLAPALIQVMAALSEAWPAVARAQGWVVGMGGRPDSCWMWRQGGPLLRARTPDDPPMLPR